MSRVKLTEEKMKEICHLISCGNYVKTSVLACGINFNTYMDCMKKGKKGEGERNVKFFQMQEKAKAKAEIGMSNRINESAEAGNVGADMWKLSRMFPQRWGQTKRIEAKVDNSQKIEIVRYSDVDKE